MDLIIRHTRLKGRAGSWDIGINGDRIAALSEKITDTATLEMDAAGNLVMPTYVNGHIHLDKCFLQEKMRPNKDYTFGECLELTWEHKARYTTEDILERAGRAVEEGILNGATVFRAFADVDSYAKLRGLEGLLALRERWRGITRVKQLWQHGVNVFSSQDDVADPFYPFGRNDQQEVVGYICHTAHMAAPSEIEAAFDFVTYNAARALHLQDYGLEPGCKADLNVLAAPTVREVLRLQQPPGYVIREGKVLARTILQREFIK